MPIVNRFAEFHDDIVAWRRDLHRHPEILYEVHRTAATVAEKLRAFGVDEVVTGIGRTGVVGVIRGRRNGSGRVIGLRADMDALPHHARPPASPTPRRSPARCTPAAMTATPPCCSGRPATSPRRAISTARRS